MTPKWRCILLFVMGLYVTGFHWVYVNYLYPGYAYLGYDYNPPSTGYWSLAFALSVMPALWMPLRLTRPSQFVYWILYITVFIPSMLVPLYAGYQSAPEIALLMIVLFLAFILTGLGYVLPLWQVAPSQMSQRRFWRLLGVLAVALTAWLIVIFRQHLHFVSFNDIYDLRFEASDIMEGTSIHYAFMPLTGAINPFLMAFGLHYHKRLPLLCGACGQLLVYSVLGTKGSIISVAVVPVVYRLLKVRKLPLGLTLAAASGLLMVTTRGILAIPDTGPGTLTNIALFVVFARTLSMGGLLTAQYSNFFATNPTTYWSHLKVISSFVHYPYPHGIGQEIGLAYAGTTDLNATAHFYASDGIAAAGLPGIIIVGLVAALIFWLLDSGAQHCELRFSILAVTYAAFNLANISIFTSSLSGGLGLLMLGLYYFQAGHHPDVTYNGLSRDALSAVSG